MLDHIWGDGGWRWEAVDTTGDLGPYGSEDEAELGLWQAAYLFGQAHVRK